MARDFENAKTHNGIHYSRYIASWKRKGGKLYVDDDSLFIRWLKEKEGLTDDEISDIRLLVTNGKLELETSAMLFMNQNHYEYLKEKEDNYKECF